MHLRLAILWIDLLLNHRVLEILTQPSVIDWKLSKQCQHKPTTKSVLWSVINLKYPVPSLSVGFQDSIVWRYKLWSVADCRTFRKALEKKQPICRWSRLNNSCGKCITGGFYFILLFYFLLLNEFYYIYSCTMIITTRFYSIFIPNPQPIPHPPTCLLWKT